MDVGSAQNAGWAADLKDARTLLAVLARAVRPDQAAYVRDVIEQCDRCLKHLEANEIREASRIFEEISLEALRFDEETTRMCEIIEERYLSAWARQREWS